MRKWTVGRFAVVGLLLSSVVSEHADAQQLLMRREVGGPSLIMEVWGEDSVISPGPIPILSTEYVLQMRNFTNGEYECDGRIAFYNVTSGSGSAFPVTASAYVPPGGPWVVVRTDVRSDALLGLDRNGTTVACAPVDTGGGPGGGDDGGGGGGGTGGGGTGGGGGGGGGGGTGGGGGGGGGTSGPPTINGSYSYSISRANNQATLAVQEVRNPSSTRTTNSLQLELWVTSVPYAGGSLSGQRLASAPIPQACGANSQLGPGAACGPITLTASYTAPAPGSYNAVLLLTEFSPPGCTPGLYCISDWRNFSNLFVAEATPPPSSGGLEMTGAMSYNVSLNSNLVFFNVDRVANTSSTRTSGTLRLELWAMSEPYHGQSSITGYRFFKGTLPTACGLGNGQLGPNQGCTQIQLSGGIDNRPPPGTYYIAAFLGEFDSSCSTSDQYCFVVGRTFPDQLTVSPPLPLPTPTGGGDGGGGGGGALDPLALGGLLALLGLSCLRRRARVGERRGLRGA